MERALVYVRFPVASLPGIGFRCPLCGDEALLGEELARVQEAAHALGYFGAEDRRRRKILRVGNSIAVTLEPDLAKDLLGSARPGTEVYVGRMGGRIVIEPVDRRLRGARKRMDLAATALEADEDKLGT